MKKELKNFVSTILLISLSVISSTIYANNERNVEGEQIQVALLSDIMFYDETAQSFVSMSDFDAETLNYEIELPWRAETVPAIQPVPGGKVQRVTINEGGVDEKTTINVLAEDGETNLTYTLNFSSEKSKDSSLSNILVSGVALEGFEPSKFDYVVELPYGTTEAPSISYEKAYKNGEVISEQNVVVSESGINGTTRLTVVAQDGISASTYSISYKVSESGMQNKPANIFVGNEALALQDGVFDYEVELPLGLTELPTIDVVKLYAEQEVRIVKNATSYNVSLISNQTGVADVAYNISFLFNNVESAAYLTSISATEMYPAFSPEVTKYVAKVTSDSEVTYSVDDAVNSVSTSGSTSNKKVFTVTNIVNPSDVRTYTVYLHYKNDVIPNGEFSNWTTAANNGAAKPTSWQVPADAIAKYSGFGSYTTGSEVKNNGDGTVQLNTVYQRMGIGGSVPGMMTLGSISMSFAAANGSTSSVSGGVTFRNTPDNIEFRYQYKSTKNIKNIRCVYKLEGNSKTYTKEYTDGTSSSDWKNVNIPLTNDGITTPSSMNLIINAGHSENCKDLGGSFASEASSTMNVDYVRFSYNSAISTIKVNGVVATKSGNAFTATIDAEYVGRPEINIVGEVEDQAYDVVWTEETSTSYKANIRSYAEDGTYTDYTLVVTRELSANNNLAELNVNGAYLDLAATEFVVNTLASEIQVLDVVAKAASSRATVELISLAADNSVNVKVVAENGAEKVYSIKQEKEYSNDATLKNITVDGFDIAFDPATLTYNVNLGAAEIPAISYVKKSDAQAVELSVAETTTIKVTAENGVDSQTYNIVFAREAEATTALLQDLVVYNSGAIAFDANTFEYVSTLNSDDFVQIYYKKEFDLDNINIVRTDNVVTIEVSNEKGLRNTYTIEFVKPLSTNSTLNDIQLDGVSLEVFDAQVYDYVVELPVGTENYPAVTYTAGDEYQVINKSISENVVTINVIAEDGITISTYTIEFVVLQSNNADIAALYVNGELIAGFDPSIIEYTYTLSLDDLQLPVVTYEAGDQWQTFTEQMGGASFDYTLTVLAGDGITSKTYVIHFVTKPTEPEEPKELEFALIGNINGQTLYGFEEGYKLTNIGGNVYTVEIEFNNSVGNYVKVITNEGEIWSTLYDTDIVSTDVDSESYAVMTKEQSTGNVNISTIAGSSYIFKFELDITAAESYMSGSLSYERNISTSVDEQVEDYVITANNGLITVVGSEFTVMNILGQDVTNMNGELSQGIYVVNLKDNKSVKIMMR